ncbi:hypothetical protein D3C81_549580 [compost metagenome]
MASLCYWIIGDVGQTVKCNFLFYLQKTKNSLVNIFSKMYTLCICNKSVCNNHIQAYIHQNMICAILCFACIDPEMSLICPVFPMKNPLRFATIKSIFADVFFTLLTVRG